ncbi:MAG: NUDIX domain-containing protein [Verrucomicrobiales bacterium]|nr:NUDIX domain-containing protein [Verrucomicrobiales bacterium]
MSAGLPLPYRVATLLYAFDRQERVLLLERLREPNRGLWSPPGGKLHTDLGESPHQCAIREAGEELGVRLSVADLHLTGMVSESGYEGAAHWLMFLFEIRTRLSACPPDMAEGRFRFVAREELPSLALPVTDRERIWPWFWAHRGGFFAAHCCCLGGDQHQWTLETSRPAC